MRNILSRLMTTHKRCVTCNDLFPTNQGCTVWESAMADRFYCYPRGCYARYSQRRAGVEELGTKVEAKLMERDNLKEVELTGIDFLILESALNFLARHMDSKHFKEVEEGKLEDVNGAELADTAIKITNVCNKYRAFRADIREEVEAGGKK